MKKTFFFFLLLIMSSPVCWGQRYSHQIFDEVVVATQTYASNGHQMDIYQPVDDEHKSRPLVLFVHGGGFAGGARNEPEIMDFCKNMARRGMVAVSITYSLVMKGRSFSCDCPAADKLWAFEHTAREIYEATNYLLEREVLLNIDPSKIVLVGSSAGAEAVLHAAFWEEGKRQLPNDFKYGGLISMAGALHNLEAINNASVIPMQFFHGTCDDLVPYDIAPHHYCHPSDTGYLVLNGPAGIVRKLHTMNKGYYLVTGCGDNHVWAGRPFKKYRSEVADFILHDVMENKVRQIHQIIPGDHACGEVELPECCNSQN